MTSKSLADETRLDWLKRVRSQPCPTCQPHQVKESIVRNTLWCPTCERVWRIRRSSYGVYWFYSQEREV